MKERVLQYLWKYRLYDDADLRTTTGDPVTVIDPGLTNTDAGADFFNAKLRIAGTSRFTVRHRTGYGTGTTGILHTIR